MIIPIDVKLRVKLHRLMRTAPPETLLQIIKWFEKREARQSTLRAIAVAQETGQKELER